MLSLGDVFNDMSKKLGDGLDIERLGLKDDEYIFEDNIYCEVCKTPRTTHINLLGQERIVRCICKCEKEEMQQEEQKKELQAKIEKIQRLQSNSLIGNKYRNINFSNTIVSHNDSFKQAYERCKKYCENADECIEKGLGIYMYSNPGTGKTHLTACMANELIKQHKTVIFTNFFNISREVRETYNKSNIENETNVIKKYKDAEILFLDDLGTESLAKNEGDNFLQDLMFEIINYRYNEKKSTIFTSNYTLNELVTSRNIQMKTVDRIRAMGTVVLKIEGESYRGIEKKQQEVPF